MGSPGAGRSEQQRLSLEHLKEMSFRQTKGEEGEAAGQMTAGGQGSGLAFREKVPPQQHIEAF